MRVARMCRRRGPESGATAVEFALLLAPLVILTAGIVGYAGVLSAYLTSQHAVSEIARSVVAGQSPADRAAIFSRSVGQVIPVFVHADCVTFDFVERSGEFEVAARYDYATDRCRPTPSLPFVPVPPTLDVRTLMVIGAT